MFSIESLRCNLLKNEKVSVQKNLSIQKIFGFRICSMGGYLGSLTCFLYEL